MIRGFFFDLDGTLVDTHQANFRAYKRGLEDVGVSISFDDFKSTIGMQAQDFLPLLAPGLSPEQYLKVAERKAVYYKDFLHMTESNKALGAFIRTVKGHYITALVTTAKRASAEAVIGHHGLKDFLDIIVAAEDVTKSKPSPEGYLLALNKAGLQPDEVISFEDSETGRMASEAAGIAVVMVGDFAV